MMKSAYTYSLTTAIILSLLLISGCSGGAKRETIHIDQQREIAAKSAEQVALDAEVEAAQYTINLLVDQARWERPQTFALEQLYALSQDTTLPEISQGQAALQYAELLFEFERPDAFSTSEAILAQWKNHPYAAKIHLLLAQQWIMIENNEAAMSELTAALSQPSLDAYTLADIVNDAEPILGDVSEQSSVNWLLAASLRDTENKELWLKQAAKLSSLSSALELRRSEHPILPEQANYYRYVARERLMVGDYHAVRVLAKILDVDMPDSDATAIVKHWAESEGELTVVGVMLPLTGKYALYGQQALQGIRLAISRPEFERNVILRIQDTAGDSDNTIRAYHQLLSEGAQWIIGPLLSHNTAALTPYIIETTPIISLSNQVHLAGRSPALFIHSLAKTVQADFMAHYALAQGKKRMVIIYNYQKSTVEEAAAFAQTFMDNGGEIIDMMALKKGISDNRSDLVSMRSRTDDETLLANLEQDLYLFGPDLDIDINMPLNMDAIYIAASGKKISVLAGQMAYSDINHIQIYGSHRWDDGHLLDDKGRYLNHAEFATPITSLPQPDQAISDVQNQYRGIWAKDNSISPLFALAYDTAMNIASLGTRLGIQGKEAIEELSIAIEFPAISGSYYFDENGISQKVFAIQRIYKGKLKTVQGTRF